MRPLLRSSRSWIAGSRAKNEATAKPSRAKKTVTAARGLTRGHSTQAPQVIPTAGG